MCCWGGLRQGLDEVAGDKGFVQSVIGEGQGQGQRIASPLGVETKDGGGALQELCVLGRRTSDRMDGTLACDRCAGKRELGTTLATMLQYML